MQTVGRTSWTWDQSVARSLPTRGNINRIIADKQLCLKLDFNPGQRCFGEDEDSCCLDRAVVWAVSRRLSSTQAEDRAQVRSRGVCGRQRSSAADFLGVLQFFQPHIPPTSPHLTSPIIRSWYNRPKSGRRTK
jgi:hypothetical protein